MDPIGGELVLTFLDLQEVRYVDAFLKKGVSWQTVRAVEEQSQRRLKSTHPFCTQRFKVFGREVFVEVGGKILEFLTNQRTFEEIVRPFLQDVDFEDQHPRRWWFLGHGREVVLDPERSFGKPILNRSGCPTRVVAKALRAEGSISRVARWYGIEESAVQDAVDCEERLKGRAA
jgi:uncharacterized protein (DUF433 family)